MEAVWVFYTMVSLSLNLSTVVDANEYDMDQRPLSVQRSTYRAQTALPHEVRLTTAARDFMNFLVNG